MVVEGGYPGLCFLWKNTPLSSDSQKGVQIVQICSKQWALNTNISLKPQKNKQISLFLLSIFKKRHPMYNPFQTPS